MNNTATHQHANTAPALLPEDSGKALNMLIRLTQNLSQIADRETQALAQNDMLSFAILQDEKTLVTEQYVRASEEFRSKLNIFRGSDPALLNRLEKLQIDLGEKTKNNNESVNRIYDRAQTKTQSSLLAAQELGQNHKIEYADNKEKTANNQKGV